MATSTPYNGYRYYGGGAGPLGDGWVPLFDFTIPAPPTIPDEVWVGPDEPVDSEANLWYDTDEPNPNTANTARWNTSWGRVGASLAWDSPTSGTTAITVGTTALTLMMGRNYAVHLNNSGSYISGGAAKDSYRADFQVDGVTVGSNLWALDVTDAYLPGATTVLPFTVATTGTKTLRFQFVRQTVAGAGVMTARGNFIVYDVGPVTIAAVNPPAGEQPIVASGNAIGIVARGSLVTGAPLTIPASSTVTLTNPLVFTPSIGRRYRIRFLARAVQGSPIASANSCVLNVYKDGVTQNVILGDRYHQFMASNSFDHLEGEWLFDGDGASHTFDARGFTNQAIALTVYLDYGHFYIEDVGPNTSPALPLPPAAPAWTPMPLAAGWRHYSATPPYTCDYRKIGDETQLRGLLEWQGGAAITATQSVCVFPAGFTCPTHNAYFFSERTDAGIPVRFRLSGGSGSFDITSHGAGFSIPVGQYMTLDHMRWSTTS